MGRREMRPLLLRVGVALFLSFAGYIYTHLRSRGDSRHGRPPQSASGGGVGAGGEEGGGLGEGLLHAQREEASSDERDGISGKGVVSSTAGQSPGSKNLGDEGYLLPEFNELVLREFESFGVVPDDLKATPTDRLLPDRENFVSEQELLALRNLAHLLQERVACLEMQLLEYYGLKEQDSAVRELENHMKINTVEAKLLSMKIKSLQAENRRLEAQVSDYSRIKAELESSQARIKDLEKKLQSNSVQANEKVAELQHRIAVLRDREFRGEEDHEEVEKKVKHLEDEAAELRRENSMTMENLDLAKKLSTQLLASSVLESTEATKVLEEANHLRQMNDKLTKEVAQLQIDRCADVEELVYLRWVNACLRYELRNYQPPPGKPLARDLSNTLSPKSEQKAKQLILEYANSGINETITNLMDFDSEYCSSSHSSSLTENGEIYDTSGDVSTATKSSSSSKARFLRKLKRLVLGKDIHHNKNSSTDRSPTIRGTERRASVSGCSFDDMMGRSSYDSLASCLTSDNAPGNQLMTAEGNIRGQQHNETPWIRNLSRVSLDFQRLKNHENFGVSKAERSKSDVGTSYWHTMHMGEESLLGSPRSSRFIHEMLDFSELEMNSGHASNSPSGKPKQHKMSASLSLH